MKEKLTEKEIIENLEREKEQIFESFFGFGSNDDLDTVIKKLTEKNKNKG